MSFLYFLQEEADGPIKIGHSAWPWRRLQKLQCGNHRLLRFLVVAAAPHSKDVERTLQRELRSHHIFGEWFTSAEPVLAAAKRFSHVVCCVCGGRDGLSVAYPYNSKVGIVTCVSCGGTP